MPNQDGGNWFKRLSIALAVLALLIAVAAVAVVYFLAPTQEAALTAMARLKVVLSYEILILTFFYGLMVLLAMASGEIDLSMLLSEPKGKDANGNPQYGASMSRFQLLIFTFVIGLSLLLIIIANGAKQFPAIPSEVLVLLGISASTYAVGKGIQTSNGGGGKPGAGGADAGGAGAGGAGAGGAGAGGAGAGGAGAAGAGAGAGAGGQG